MLLLMLLLLHDDQIMRQRRRVGRSGRGRRRRGQTAAGTGRRSAQIERAGTVGAEAGDVAARRGTATQVERGLAVVHGGDRQRGGRRRGRTAGRGGRGRPAG